MPHCLRGSPCFFSGRREHVPKTKLNALVDCPFDSHSHPILQMRKLRLREKQQLAWSYTAFSARSRHPCSRQALRDTLML